MAGPKPILAPPAPQAAQEPPAGDAVVPPAEATDKIIYSDANGVIIEGSDGTKSRGTVLERKDRADGKGADLTVDVNGDRISLIDERSGATRFFSDTLPRFGHLQLDARWAPTYGGTTLSNADVDPNHGGKYKGYDLGVSWMYDFNKYASLGLGANFSGRKSTADFSGVTSYLDKSTWGVGPVLNINPIPQWLRVSTALYLGSSSISSGDETADGVDGGGAIYGKNPIKYNIKDNKDTAVGFALCVGVPEFLQTTYFGMGADICYKLTHSKHDLTPDAIDRSASDPAIPVDASDHAFLAGFTFRVGKNAPQSLARAEDEYFPVKEEEAATPPTDYTPTDEEAPAEEEAPADEPAPVEETPAPQAPQVDPAVQAIVDNVNSIEADISKPLAANHEKAAKDHLAYMSSKDPDKALATDHAHAALEEYTKAKETSIAIGNKAGNVIISVDKLSKDMKAESKKPALDAIEHMQAQLKELDAAKEKARQAALEVLTAYYKITGYTKAENKWTREQMAALKKEAPAK